VNVAVQWESNQVHVRFSQKKMLGFADTFVPPLAELGYREIESMRWSARGTSLVGGLKNMVLRVPATAWAAGAAIGAAALIAYCVRRALARRQGMAVESK
jgi:hypothetical protein